jgi:Na+-driven multidrug efflux pump
LLFPRFFGVEGVAYAQPVTDLLSFILAMIMLADEFRKMPKEDKKKAVRTA